MTGTFTDSPVAGLTYTTSSGLTGTTTQLGQYNYHTGDTVTFQLYGTTLNTSAASLVLTPADAKDVDLDYTVNLLRFLQTIDTDQDLSNGITLPTVSAADASYVINFNQDIYAFEQDASVLAFLSKYASGRSLVDVNTAISNFDTTIQATSNDVVLDLTGKHLVGINTNNACNNNDAVKTTLQYDVTATGYHEYGTAGMGFNSTGLSNSTPLGSVTCYAGTTADDVTSTFSTMVNPQNTFYGGPAYTYRGMNRIGIRSKTITPSNGLDSIVLIWHTPGTSTITALRHYIKTTGVTPNFPYYTMKSVYTITGDSSSSTGSSSVSSPSSSSASGD